MLHCSILIRPVVKIVLGATVELINILLVCTNFDGSIFSFHCVTPLLVVTGLLSGPAP